MRNMMFLSCGFGGTVRLRRRGVDMYGTFFIVNLQAVPDVEAEGFQPVSLYLDFGCPDVLGVIKRVFGIGKA